MAIIPTSQELSLHLLVDVPLFASPQCMPNRYLYVVAQ